MISTIGLLCCAFVLGPSLAEASGSGTSVIGKWAGTGFASGAIDLNGDGFGARTFDARAYDQFTFSALQGAVDTGIVAVPGQLGNTCPNPAAEFELEPYGTVTLRGWRDSAVFTRVDSSVHLCFNPAAPDETLVANIIGGTGAYAGSSGTVTFRLFDTVLEATPEGFPLVVDTQGEFTVQFD